MRVLCCPPMKALVAAVALLAAGGVLAQEAVIRKMLAERLKLLKIDDVTRSPVSGLYEVRYDDTEILYTDEKGDYIVLGGSLIDTRTRTNLTTARIDKLLAIDFARLPFKDAIAIKQGNGSRRMAVFVDPNCGYCKQFERDVASVKDVTVYTFLMPILGADSSLKSKTIWCAKDPAQTWRAWMLDGVPPRAGTNSIFSKCDAAAVDRNVDFARKQKINGTPAVFFTDGTRKPGAIPAAMVEKLLAAAAAPNSGNNGGNNGSGGNSVTR